MRGVDGGVVVGGRRAAAAPKSRRPRRRSRSAARTPSSAAARDGARENQSARLTGSHQNPRGFSSSASTGAAPGGTRVSSPARDHTVSSRRQAVSWRWICVAPRRRSGALLRRGLAFHADDPRGGLGLDLGFGTAIWAFRRRSRRILRVWVRACGQAPAAPERSGARPWSAALRRCGARCSAARRSPCKRTRTPCAA